MVSGRPNILMLSPDTVAGNHLSKTFPTREEVQRSMAPEASKWVQKQRKVSSQHYNVGTSWLVHKTPHRAIKCGPTNPRKGA